MMEKNKNQTLNWEIFLEQLILKESSAWEIVQIGIMKDAQKPNSFPTLSLAMKSTFYPRDTIKSFQRTLGENNQVMRKLNLIQ